MRGFRIFPDPGVLPKFPPHRRGARIVIELQGRPPHKDSSFSIRNPRHPRYDSFVRLRRAAIKAMGGRKWCEGAIEMSLTVKGKSLDRPLVDYVGGVMDTLDGSHGPAFTYL